MTKRNTFFAAFILTLLCATVISSCKKPADGLPLEPISIQMPDSLISYAFADSIVPVKVAITTDRPINWVLCVYDIDTLINATTYTPTYPDTLFLTNLQNLNPRVNLYTAISSYHIPDSLVPFSVIRFKVSFEAGSTTFVQGQNYPANVVTNQKEFLINIQ